MSAARNFFRELLALGAQVERDDDRLILRAGRQPIPQFLVQRARAAKHELLALFDELDGLRPPTQNSPLPTSQKLVAVLGENDDESRRNADDLLRPPRGGLSGGLRSDSDPLAVFGDNLMEAENEDFCGIPENGAGHNRCVSDAIRAATPKTATPNEELAVLANGQDVWDTQGPPAPNTATLVCGEPSHAAAQQTAPAKRINKTSGSEQNAIGDTIISCTTCCECGLPISERLETWWGGERCHRGVR